MKDLFYFNINEVFYFYSGQFQSRKTPVQLNCSYSLKKPRMRGQCVVPTVGVASRRVSIQPYVPMWTFKAMRCKAHILLKINQS